LQAYRSHGLDSGVAGVCCTGRNRYGEMAPLGDYLMIDIYPRAGVLSVNRFYNLAKSCANGKPIWQLNQGFDYDSSVALEKDFTPSVHQARYAHWATLRHGLQGVGLYNCGPKDYLRAFPRLFEQLSETYRQTMALSFAWVEPSLEGVLKHEAPLESRVVRHGGRVYAIVQNSSLEPQTARIQVNGQFQPTIRVLYENRTLTLDKGRFQDVFQALDTRLYLLEE